MVLLNPTYAIENLFCLQTALKSKVSVQNNLSPTQVISRYGTFLRVKW